MGAAGNERHIMAPAAIRPPKYPPTAPAAITAIRISQRSSCTGKGARCAAADALDLCFLFTDGSTASTTLSVILSCGSNAPADARRYAIWRWMTPSQPLSASLVMELLEQRAHLDRRHLARIGHDRCDREALAVDLPGEDGRRRRARSALRPRLAALTLGPGRSRSALFPGTDDQLPVLARTRAGLILAGDKRRAVERDDIEPRINAGRVVGTVSGTTALAIGSLPGGPGSPLSPLSPGVPGTPGSPCGPIGPAAPRSPFGPLACPSFEAIVLPTSARSSAENSPSARPTIWIINSCSAAISWAT